MSFLDPPRIHFGGAFFAGPSTINNYIKSYPRETQLTDSTGAYQKSTSGWNPTGLSQLYFQGCRVNSVVAPDWSSIMDASKESLLGVSVLTLSPNNPVLGGGVPSSFPKLVDLDPDQQTRSEVYGLIIAVNLPGGGGFIAWFDPPQLRDMGTVIKNNAISSWGAAGAWATGARTGTGTAPVNPGQVLWLEGEGSPVYESFRAACSYGIALKLTVDLHRNQPAFQLFQGDLFCFGRVQGTFGPLKEGEFSRWAPARRLTSKKKYYNSAWFQVSRLSDGSGMLTCDLGGRVQLSTRDNDPNAPKNPDDNNLYPLSDGSPASSDAVLKFGAFKPTDTDRVTARTKDDMVAAQLDDSQPEFVAFQQGAIALAANLIEASEEARAVKACKLWQNSQVYSIPLTAAELDAIARAPVAVMLNENDNEQLVLCEAEDGISGDIDTSVKRLEQGEEGEVTVRTLKWGQPATVYMSFKKGHSQQTDLILTQKEGPEPGTIVLKVRADASNPINIPENREELDSLVDKIYPSINLGDAGLHPLLTVLLWRTFQAPANPTWEDDVEPILSEYARMYPGMKGRFDISDEATVRSNLSGMIQYMGQNPLHPAYMPVTRDMSPSRVKMILQWLKSQQDTSSTEGSNEE